MCAQRFPSAPSIRMKLYLHPTTPSKNANLFPSKYTGEEKSVFSKSVSGRHLPTSILVQLPTQLEVSAQSENSINEPFFRDPDRVLAEAARDPVPAP